MTAVSDRLGRFLSGRPVRSGGGSGGRGWDDPPILEQAGDASLAQRASAGAHIPANDDRKSTIVTGRKPRSGRSDVPDMTPEEHQRRGDAADALFREMKRRIGKV